MSSLRVISLFAGIGGFDLGATQSGMTVVAHVEKDPHCRTLLAAKWPDAVVLDDVCKAGGHNLPPCDVICGGFPCQDLSVAGKRAGLAGERSGLFYELTRITHELQPAYLIWENVPGLLSSNQGHDFLAVLTELRRIGYHGGWRTLDAQYLGVAQRRRRVFGVFARADIGAGRCAEILSLHEGVRGHPAPRREARQDVAEASGSGLAKCLRANTEGIDREDRHTLICPEVAGCLQERDAEGADSDTKPGYLIAFPQNMSATQCASEDNLSPVLQAKNPTAIAFKPASAIPINMQAATKNGEKSPNMLGIGEEGDPSPTLNTNDRHAVCFDTTQITSQGNYSQPKAGDPSHPLSSSAHPPAIAFQSRIARNGRGQPEEICPALNGSDAGATSDMRPLVATFQQSSQAGKGTIGYDESGIAKPCKTQVDGQMIHAGCAVRRLTPTECLRLQGFPDNWFDGLGFADSTKYRMCGNAVAVCVAAWLFKRLCTVSKKNSAPDDRCDGLLKAEK